MPYFPPAAQSGLTPTDPKTSDYTANFGELVLIDPSFGSNITLTLPAVATGAAENGKRLGIKVIGDVYSPLWIYLNPVGSVTVQVEPIQFTTQLPMQYGAYWEYELVWANNTATWRLVSEVRYPFFVRDIQAGASVNPAEVGTLYLIRNQSGNTNPANLYLPSSMPPGSRVAVKIVSDNSYSYVATAMVHDTSYIDGSQSIFLGAAGEYCELEYQYSPNLVSWAWRVVQRQPASAVYMDIVDIRSSDFQAQPATSHRFYVGDNNPITITLPTPAGSAGGRNTYPGDRVELIAIGHGSQTVTVTDGVYPIEFTRGLTANSATFPGNDFYMLLERYRNTGAGTLNQDGWVVVDSSVGRPGSRRRLVTLAAGDSVTAQVGDLVFADVSVSSTTVYLPATHAQGDQVTIKKNSSSMIQAVTVNPNGSTLDGSSANKSLSSAWASLVVESIGNSAWIIVAQA